MKVSYGEGLANHTGPESCVYNRKVMGEALTGESAGRVLSRERMYCFGVPTASICTEGKMEHIVNARGDSTPRGRRPRARMEASCTGTGRSRVRPWKMALRSAS